MQLRFKVPRFTPAGPDYIGTGGVQSWRSTSDEPFHKPLAGGYQKRKVVNPEPWTC